MLLKNKKSTDIFMSAVSVPYILPWLLRLLVLFSEVHWLFWPDQRISAVFPIAPVAEPDFPAVQQAPEEPDEVSPRDFRSGNPQLVRLNPSHGIELLGYMSTQWLAVYGAYFKSTSSVSTRMSSADAVLVTVETL